MKKVLFFSVIALSLFVLNSFAEELTGSSERPVDLVNKEQATDATAIEATNITNTQPEINEEFLALEKLLKETPDETECSTKAFSEALKANSSKISETSSEEEIQTWITETMASKEVLKQVLECPEFKNVDELDTVTLIPIQYVFPQGRTITINYETQPKVLKQRLLLATKRSLPSQDPNPRIGSLDDDSIWTNTNPAWYAILITEAGALKDFVGPEKNNTISIDYIAKNIDKLYPNNLNLCTNRSALAKDNAVINKAVGKAANIEDDKNDYYVAGDVDLRWISYVEMGLDVAITVVTFGGGTVVAGMAKAARASRTLKNLNTSLSTLRKSESVVNFIKISSKINKATDEIKAIDKAKDMFNRIARLEKNLDKANDARKASLTKELTNLRKNYTDELTKLSKKADDFKNVDDFDSLKALKNNDLKELEKGKKTLEEVDDVKKYQTQSKTFSDLNEYRNALRGIKIPQRGNIIARSWKALKAAGKGTKQLNKGAKVARASMQSGKVRDWLFQATRRSAAVLGKVERNLGLTYGVVRFVGDMYDWTEVSTGEYTNNIDFAPLLLLSADDLPGEENVVNYGMWLKWAGDSINPEDDDTAFLQAMDFADKVHYAIEQEQEERNSYPCNIDIYVVRPVIRNPGTEDAELYYLFMNDEPWTTSKILQEQNIQN